MYYSSIMHLSFGTNSVGIRNLSVKQMEVGTLPCGKLMTTKKSIKSIKQGPEMNIRERHHFKQSTIYSFALYIDPMSSIHHFLGAQTVKHHMG